MTELIQFIINSDMTWAAAITVMVLLLRPVLISLARGWVEAMRARIDNEKEQTRVLRDVEHALNANSNLTQSILQLLQPLASIPGEVGEISRQAGERAEAYERLLDAYGERLKEIPREVLEGHQRHFDPQLEAIRDAVEKLRQQVEKHTEQITEKDVAAIRASLARIERLLNEVN